MAPFVISIDQGTSSSRVLLVDCTSGIIPVIHNIPLPNIYPHEGWVEICPDLILSTTLECISQVVIKASEKGTSFKNYALCIQVTQPADRLRTLRTGYATCGQVTHPADRLRTFFAAIS